MQCVLFAAEEKHVPFFVTPLVTAVIAAAVGAVGGFSTACEI